MQCWGADTEGQASPPEGAYEQVSTGWDFTCAIQTDFAVTCWGKDDFGQSTPPE